MHLPSLRQLQYLCALREHKSFSRAAEHCHVSQSALSNGIKELEEILLQPVVTRSTRRVTLTAAGEELAQDSEKIINHLQTLTFNIQRSSKPMSGTIRLGVIPTIAPYLLPIIMPHVARTFPDLDLQIQEGLSADLVEKLKNDQLDCLLMAFPYDAPPGCRAHIFYTEPFLLAAPLHNDMSGDLSINDVQTGDIDGLKLLLLEDGHCLSDHALKACNLSKTLLQQEFRASSLQTILEMVRGGHGITLLPHMAVGALQNQHDTLDIIPFTDPQPTRDIGLLWRNQSYLAKDIALLTETIEGITSTSL